ncbi:SRPBCC family protein [Glycomyces harbinensis]|uniref:Uncharacterized conserved protein YndB, AHSA1/START domain n=1 Tax=Glycomyces harbinensis TaxID=58114 RepID=A0A1G7CDQ8_9ACTN|nr:SRPBCC domain-containing protein [Glycomyces harbinensis]SDE37524.1 Uncharacterized conserved protein YndB, AHSA1/START domain [Glycomyces harbinensis]
MVDILHRTGFENTSTEKVYEALTTLDGLRGWWTGDTTGKTDLHDVIAFRFPDGGFDMKITELAPGRRVEWEVVGGTPEWIGTKVHWDLKQDGDWAILLFKHEGWREPVEFMHHCSSKWGTFLISLKHFVETGKGEPAPNDVKTDNW